MASDLRSVLQQIKNDKQLNLLPENIREGITILGITGTYAGDYPSDGSEEDTKKGA